MKTPERNECAEKQNIYKQIEECQAAQNLADEKTAAIIDTLADIFREVCQLKTQRDDLLAACKKIQDGPDHNCAEIHLTDNYQQGLFCGLEDRDIVNRYDACMYGFEKAVERVTEWAKGMVDEAIAKTEGKS